MNDRIPHLRLAALNVIYDNNHVGDNTKILPVVRPRLNDKYAIIRYYAARILEDKKDRGAVLQLIARLTDTNPEVRTRVALALRAIKDPRAVPAFIEALKDPKIFLDAVFFLGEMKDKRAIEPLIEFIKMIQSSRSPWRSTWCDFALDAIKKIDYNAFKRAKELAEKL
jgi:HEAT repeat protein